MNYKFRKKPLTIEAFQMTKERRWDNIDWPQWLNIAWNTEPRVGGMWCSYKEDESTQETLYIGTPEGIYKISWGDWIIQGIKGELNACGPDIFEQTYEAVEEK